MTVRQILDQVSKLRRHPFTDEQLLTWLNEVEGYVMTEVFRAPIQLCFEYRLAVNVTMKCTFPDSGTMILEADEGFAPGGELKIAGLTTYPNNNGGPYTVRYVSDDGLTIEFDPGTFSDTGEDPDDASLTWDGGSCRLLVMPPHDKLYRPYMLAQIAFAQEEWDGYSNYMAMFNECLGEYRRWYGREYRPAWRGRYLHGHWKVF